MSVGDSLRRILAVTRKELLHLSRDRRMLPIVFAMPVVQLTILGYAANFDVVNVPVAVVDQDRSSVSRAITARLDAGEAFTVVEVTSSEARAETMMDAGDASVVLVAPPGLGRDMRRGNAVNLPVWVDGTDTNRALMAQEYLQVILARVAGEIMPTNAQGLMAGLPDARPRVLYNPTLQSRWFLVPGVLVMVLTIMTVLLASMAIVKERERGTIEQLSVTPIRPVELLVGKLTPFVLVGLVVGALVVLVSRFWFEIPFQGSVLELSGMVALYLVSTLAMGLLVSTISTTQQQAMMATLLFVLPSILLGGVVYPISNMPHWAQVLADFLPIRYFIVMVRGVFLKGTGFSLLWREAVALAVLGVVLVLIAVFRFRKRSA